MFIKIFGVISMNVLLWVTEVFNVVHILEVIKADREWCPLFKAIKFKNFIVYYSSKIQFKIY